MTTSGDPRLPSNEPPRRSMPWPQRSRYQPGPNFPTLATDPLRPLYTEKLAKSPRFPSLAQAAQRRRDFWSLFVGRGGLGLMVGSGAAALWLGTSEALKAFGVIGGTGLIIFVATCFYSGCRNRTRVL